MRRCTEGEDDKEQRNRLERERNRLLNCLREVNEDGARSLSPHASDFFEPAQAELMELNMEAECSTPD
ncbi:hypothetical protein EV122DRAFT_283902 [Schizophyllum commune]